MSQPIFKNNAYLSNLNIHQTDLERLESIQSLRDSLSNFLNISKNISFRHNTTSIFIDILHSLRNIDSYTLVYSDLEHPCIQNVIEICFPQNRLARIELYDLLLLGKIDEIEKEIYQASKSKSIYLVSQVLWHTGVKIDIELMAKKIKDQNPLNILIVDGAQAVGNINNLFSNDFDLNLIDFYIGCIHKWIGSKNLLGFTHVSKNLLDVDANIIDEIFINDIFSVYAGAYSFYTQKHSMSTYNISLLLEMTTEMNQLTSDFQFSKYYSFDIKEEGVFLIPIQNHRETRFTAIYGEPKKLFKICQKLDLGHNYIVKDKLLPKSYSWLRLGI